MTMKTKTILLALVAMTALFCACDDEEESTELDLKVNQLSYDGKVFDVETKIHQNADLQVSHKGMLEFFESQKHRHQSNLLT